MSQKITSILFSLLLLAANMQAAGPRVLFMGDSITDGGWGGGGYRISSAARNHWDQNHLYGSGYMYLCAAHYLGDCPEREYVFFNRGISGNTLNDLEQRWDEDVIALHADVLSVLVGINDVLQYFDRKNSVPFDLTGWEQQYRSLLDRALQDNPALKLVLGTPFVYPTGKMSKAANFDERNRLVRRCAAVVEQIARDYRAVYLPYHAMYDELLATCPTGIDTYWVWDGVHPTVAGHQRMAKLWVEEVDKAGLLK